MTEFSVGVVLPRTDEELRQPIPDDIGSFGTVAEELGYDSVWTNERGSDSLVELTQIAEHTERVRIGTSVLNVFTRSPLVLAMAGASLARVSDGRVVLGIGASHPGKIEDLHGLEFRDPIGRTRETIELIRGYTSGESPFDHRGKIFEMEGLPSRRADVPVYNAALGETNRRLTGGLCDGWIPYHIPFPALADAFEAVAEGARDVDRDPEEIEVTPVVPATVREDSANARDEIRTIVASFVGRYGDDTYKSAVASTFPDEADRIADAWRAGNHEEAAEHVTDTMVDALGIAGTPDTARDQLRALLEHPVIDTPIVNIPYGSDETRIKRTMIELSPELL